jgi:Ca2+-binding EF-hand superfamily protein
MGMFGGQRPDRAKMQEKFFAEADANGDGGIDKAELTTALDALAKKSGKTVSVDVDELFTTLDSGGDGSISASELSENARALVDKLRGQLGGPRHHGGGEGPPPPNAEDFLKQTDTDEDGSISRDELTAFFEKAHERYLSVLSGTQPSEITLSATA